MCTCVRMCVYVCVSVYVRARDRPTGYYRRFASWPFSVLNDPWGRFHGIPAGNIAEDTRYSPAETPTRSLSCVCVRARACVYALSVSETRTKVIDISHVGQPDVTNQRLADLWPASHWPRILHLRSWTTIGRPLALCVFWRNVCFFLFRLTANSAVYLTVV